MNIAIIGRGGHSKVVEDIIKSSTNYKIVGYLDDRYGSFKKIGDQYYGPIASVQRIQALFTDLSFVITIGNNHVRKSIAQKLSLFVDDYATLIHRRAVVSPNARIEPGSVVMASAVINADSRIGQHSIINTNAVIEHDNIISDFVHISPSVTLTGAVSIGEGAHIGAGAIIIPNKQVGEWSVVGAGATVIQDIPSFCTAIGVPAKVIQRQTIKGV